MNRNSLGKGRVFFKACTEGEIVGDVREFHPVKGMMTLC